MKKSKRLKLATDILLRGEVAIAEWLDTQTPAKSQPEAEPVNWFREQSLATFERRRAEKEAREEHVQFRNDDWTPAQPALW